MNDGYHDTLVFGHDVEQLVKKFWAYEECTITAEVHQSGVYDVFYLVRNHYHGDMLFTGLAILS